MLLSFSKHVHCLACSFTCTHAILTPVLGTGSLSRDEAQAALARLCGDEAVQGLKHDQWKQRKEAMDAIKGQVEGYSTKEADERASELIQGVSYLPGWGEKNFQVGYIYALVRSNAGPCSPYHFRGFQGQQIEALHD